LETAAKADAGNQKKTRKRSENVKMRTLKQRKKCVKTWEEVKTKTVGWWWDVRGKVVGRYREGGGTAVGL
jgi:hypothetical protein